MNNVHMLFFLSNAVLVVSRRHGPFNPRRSEKCTLSLEALFLIYKFYAHIIEEQFYM